MSKAIDWAGAFVPWDHRDADPLRDLREVKARLERSHHSAGITAGDVFEDPGEPTDGMLAIVAVVEAIQLTRRSQLALGAVVSPVNPELWQGMVYAYQRTIRGLEAQLSRMFHSVPEYVPASWTRQDRIQAARILGIGAAFHGLKLKRQSAPFPTEVPT